jgi:hypothetical protein
MPEITRHETPYIKAVTLSMAAGFDGVFGASALANSDAVGYVWVGAAMLGLAASASCLADAAVAKHQERQRIIAVFD